MVSKRKKQNKYSRWDWSRPTPQVLYYFLVPFIFLVYSLLGFCIHCVLLGNEPRTLFVAGKALPLRSQPFQDYFLN